MVMCFLDSGNRDWGGKIDQLILYSNAVSGSYWFTLCQEDLADMLAIG